MCSTRIVGGFFLCRLLGHDGHSESEHLGAVCVLVGHRLEEHCEQVIVVRTIGVGHSGIVLVVVDRVFYSLIGLDGIVSTLYKHIERTPGQPREVAAACHVAVHGVVSTIPVVSCVGTQCVHIAHHLGQGNHELRIGHVGLVHLLSIDQVALYILCRHTVDGTRKAGCRHLILGDSAALRKRLVDTACERQCCAHCQDGIYFSKYLHCCCC